LQILADLQFIEIKEDYFDWMILGLGLQKKCISSIEACLAFDGDAEKKEG
jgi:hypothetical protein